MVFYVADGGGTAGSGDEYIRGVENGGGVQWTHGHSQSTGVAAAQPGVKIRYKFIYMRIIRSQMEVVMQISINANRCEPSPMQEFHPLAVAARRKKGKKSIT